MVLQVPWRPTKLDNIIKGPAALAVGPGGNKPKQKGKKHKQKLINVHERHAQ